MNIKEMAGLNIQIMIYASFDFARQNRGKILGFFSDFFAFAKHLKN